MAEPAAAEKRPTAAQKQTAGPARKGPADENDETPPESNAPAGSGAKRGLVIRLAAVLFLVAVVLGECLVAYRLLSAASAQSASEPAAASPAAVKERPAAEPVGGESEASKVVSPAKAPAGNPLDEADPTSAADPVEVDLGQFAVTTHMPAASTTMRIDFHLHGIVAGKDKDDFDRALKPVQQRFREQVLVTVRAAEPPDLADAGLGLIKRQILEKTNTLLGKRLLKALVVSDFSYMEQ